MWLLGLLTTGCTDDGGKPDSRDIESDSALTDADGDGYPATAHGGTDCDDENPAVNPGMSETWYDGVDADCDGWSDFDLDHDGDDALGFGGGDCSDGDPNVNSRAVETLDGSDEDCDGLIDEDFISVGEILITEVMRDPLDVEDADGQWFEVLNIGSVELDAYGWVIRTEGGSFSVYSSTPVPVGNPVVIAGSLDTALNGLSDGSGGSLTAIGVGDMGLTDAGFIEIIAGETVLVSLDWSAGGWPAAPGRSLMLDADHIDLTDAGDVAYWCLAATPYNVSDQGTPRAHNGLCDTLDHDGDGFTGADGDCDDVSPDIYPGAPEVADGRDQDCDGVLDNVSVTAIAVSLIDGDPGSFLGSSLGSGELTGDGVPDLVMGSATGAGYAHVWGGHLLGGATGLASAGRQVGITGRDETSAFGGYSRGFADVTGDGEGDLVVAGRASEFSYEPSASVYTGGVFFHGDYGEGDGLINITGLLGSGLQQVESSVDWDGDGVASTLIADPLVGAGRVTGLELGGVTGTIDLADASFYLDGATEGDLFGLGLGAGDMDGDGTPELLVGAPGETGTGGGHAGSWWVLDGVALAEHGGVVSSYALTRFASGASDGPGLGFGSAHVKDLDADGAVDLVFGSFAGGRVYLFWGAGDLLGVSLVDPEVDADLILEGDNAFGFCVGAGDADDDDIADIYVGAPAHAARAADEDWTALAGLDYGELRVYAMDDLLAAGAAATPRASYIGEDSGDLFGAMMPSLENLIRGDSTDLIVSAPRWGGDAGRVYVLPGTP